MQSPVFLTRIVLHNYKSIGHCDLRLGPLTWLVGANGCGKSNFLDALHFVRDALSATLDNALSERGGLTEVRRRSSGNPTNFGLRLEFVLADGKPGHYAFHIGARPGRGYEVQHEECALNSRARGPYFLVKRGTLDSSSEPLFPATTSDRLALASLSGMVVFRPVVDALTAMGFYKLNPKLMREPQKPQDGRLLKPAGENIVSVLGQLERVAPEKIQEIEKYLRMVVPMLHGVERKQIGPLETLEFRQDMAGSRHPWRFPAHSMSDGTLRALGILTALFQGNTDYAPRLIGIEEPETALHPAASAAPRRSKHWRWRRNKRGSVTSHSPDLLDSPEISADQLLAVVSEDGETRIAPLNEASRSVLRDRLFTAGELLHLNQLAPDRGFLQEQRQSNLFGEIP